MQRWVVAFACWLFLAPVMASEARKFPYDAVVRADNTKVRCGRGKNFYATSELPKGTPLTVYRHDPGGWYMVSPPAGSFSWIAAEHVTVDTPGTGVVTLPEGDTKGAPVWVGSELSGDHSVRQRTLQAGDTVQILGEDVFQDNSGSMRVYKIAPPVREFRWVKGDFIVPRSEDLQQEALNDPYSNPLATVTAEGGDETESTVENAVSGEANEEDGASSPSDNKTLRLIDRELVRSSESPSQASSDPKAALREIDRHYVEMIDLDPTQWDIEELVRSYEGLAASAPQLAGQIQKRLVALEDRRKLHAEYRSFAQLAAETTLRDQQLATQGQLAQADLVMNYDLGESAPLNPEIQFQPDSQFQPETQFQPEAQFASTAPEAEMSAAPATVASGVIPSQPASVSPKLNGAGIVKQLSNGRYAIVAPDGRMLALLQADRNIPLNRVVGQPMGFIGERNFDPRLGADLLIVKQMVPIQLQR